MKVKVKVMKHHQVENQQRKILLQLEAILQAKAHRKKHHLVAIVLQVNNQFNTKPILAK